jgi:hypothetical protein
MKGFETTLIHKKEDSAEKFMLLSLPIRSHADLCQKGILPEKVPDCGERGAAVC